MPIEVTDGNQMLITFAQAFPSIFFLIEVVGYVIGFVMGGVGLFALAQSYGDNPRSHGKGYGMTLMVFGALLLSFIPTLEILARSFLGEITGVNVITDPIQGTDNAFNDMVSVSFAMLILIGWISGIRGLMYLGSAGSRREQGLWKGINLLLACVVLTNMRQVLEILGNSFGLSLPLGT